MVVSGDEAKQLSKLPRLTMEQWNRIIWKKDCGVPYQQTIVTLLVPRIHWSLNIVLVSKKTFAQLSNRSNARSHTMQHETRSNGIRMLFSYDDKMEALARGVCVSSWQKGDPQISATRVEYSFVKYLIETYGGGYGSRPRSSCLDSLNAYRAKRHSRRAHPSPFIEESEIGQHQYYSCDKQKSCLLQMKLELVLRTLTNDIRLVAERLNPLWSPKMDRFATKTIATSGQSLFSFCNGLHVDSCDNMNMFFKRLLFPYPTEPWQERLVSYSDFSFPTTCGYQHVWNSANRDIVPQEYEVNHYFAMPGLGLGMLLEDSICHHFMGGSFSHCTSVCILAHKNEKTVLVNNQNDIFRIFAWGNAANSRTAKGNISLRTRCLANHRERQKKNREQGRMEVGPGNEVVLRNEVVPAVPQTETQPVAQTTAIPLQLDNDEQDELFYDCKED